MSQQITIVVEGKQHPWTKGEISYEEVVALEDPHHPERVYSVTYERGEGNKKGVLVKGAPVKVKDGMVFFVKDTGES